MPCGHPLLISLLMKITTSDGYGFLRLRGLLHRGRRGLDHGDRFFGAPGLAHPAADALHLVDDMDLADIAGDGVHRADLLAHIDAHALGGIDEGLRPDRDIIEDRAGGTLLHAESADDALAVVDPREIVLYRNGVHRAGPDADAACDASDLTLFLDVDALVPAVAADHDCLGRLGEFDHLFRTGRHALSAGGAFIRVDLRQVVGAHGDRVEGAGAHAGAIAEAPVLAGLVPAGRKHRRCAVLHAGVDELSLGEGRAALAEDTRNLGLHL